MICVGCERAVWGVGKNCLPSGMPSPKLHSSSEISDPKSSLLSGIGNTVSYSFRGKCNFLNVRPEDRRRCTRTHASYASLPRSAPIFRRWRRGQGGTARSQPVAARSCGKMRTGAHSHQQQPSEGRLRDPSSPIPHCLRGNGLHVTKEAKWKRNSRVKYS